MVLYPGKDIVFICTKLDADHCYRTRDSNWNLLDFDWERRWITAFPVPTFLQLLNPELIKNLRYFALSRSDFTDLVDASRQKIRLSDNNSETSPNLGFTVFDFMRLQFIVIVHFYPRTPTRFKLVQKVPSDYLKRILVEELNTLSNPEWKKPQLIVVQDLAELRGMLERGEFPPVEKRKVN